MRKKSAASAITILLVLLIAIIAGAAGYVVVMATNSLTSSTASTSSFSTTSTYGSSGVPNNSNSSQITTSASASVVVASPPFTNNTTQTTTSTPPNTSQLSVATAVNGGGPKNGFYTVLYQNGNIVASGYSPVQFTVSNGQLYTVQVQNSGSYYFQYWQDTGSVNINRNVTTSSNLSLEAVMCDGPPGTCPNPTPDGITVYANRIPASYWAPCFALACSAGTGPDASMYFALYDSSGNQIQGGYASEQGYTFTGLNPNTIYYVLPENCNVCHGSTHDVVFQYWGDNSSTTTPIAATVGTNLEAWFSCTNNCSGG